MAPLAPLDTPMAALRVLTGWIPVGAVRRSVTSLTF